MVCVKGLGGTAFNQKSTITYTNQEDKKCFWQR